MQNLAHSASFDSGDKDAPSKPGIKHLEADASEDELAADLAARSSTVRAFERKRPSRKPFPEHLPRERVVIAAPSNCPCCGSGKLAKLGEDITETLEVIPRASER